MNPGQTAVDRRRVRASRSRGSRSSCTRSTRTSSASRSCGAREAMERVLDGRRPRGGVRPAGRAGDRLADRLRRAGAQGPAARHARVDPDVPRRGSAAVQRQRSPDARRHGAPSPASRGPVLHFQLALREQPPLTEVFVAHLKSKLPERSLRRGVVRGGPGDVSSRTRTPSAPRMATIRRTAEATALRVLLTKAMKGTVTPVLVLGDLNDGQHSNTAQHPHRAAALPRGRLARRHRHRPLHGADAPGVPRHPRRLLHPRPRGPSRVAGPRPRQRAVLRQQPAPPLAVRRARHQQRPPQRRGPPRDGARATTASCGWTSSGDPSASRRPRTGLRPPRRPGGRRPDGRRPPGIPPAPRGYAGATAGSCSMCGSQPSFFGSHQLRSPRSFMVAGSRTPGSSVASSRIADGQADAHLLEHDERERPEDREHRDHHDRGAGHDAGGVLDAVRDRVAPCSCRGRRPRGPG